MIFISIPARDEERTIGVLLWKVRKVMAEFRRPYEVVVLDDASKDRTPEVLESYRALLPLHVIRLEEALGYGRALERLLIEVVDRSPYPKRDVAVTLQADFSESPGDLVPMVKAIEGGSDLVAGISPAGTAGLPIPRRLSKAIAPMILGRTFGSSPVTDPLNGFRAYRVIVLKKAFRDIESGQPLVSCDGWGANLEILSRTVPYARRVDEAPCTDGRSTRERESRFQALATLRALLSLRGTAWPSPQRPS